MDIIVISIFMVHIIFVIISNLLYMKKYKNKQKVLIRFIFMLFIPVAGFIGFYIIENGRTHINSEEINEIYTHGKENIERLSYLHHFDMKKELDKVPMQEALNMNEYKLRRSMVMDIIQYNDPFKYINILRDAMDNEDTETSHYAMAVILEMQKNVNNRVRLLEDKYKNCRNKKEIRKELEEYYKNIIFSALYDDRTIQRYYEKYKKLSDIILRQDFVEEKYYKNRIQIDFKTNDLENARMLCERYKKDYPASEDMVLCNIEYYVCAKKRKQLNRFLDELKSLPVQLSIKSLEYVRFLSI